MENIVNNLDLFMILREKLGSLSDSKKLFGYLQQNINVPEEKSAVLQNFCVKFCSNISARWERCSRVLAQFIRKNGDWLESSINWPEEIISASTEREEIEPCESDNTENLPPSSLEPSTSLFTPRKPFVDLGSRQKRRRVEYLNKSLSLSPEELTAVTVKNLRSAGKEKEANILTHLLDHPEDVEKVDACISKNKGPTSSTSIFSPDKALAILISLKLSKWQYINLREEVSKTGSNLYPSYYKIKQAKLNCYPQKDDVTITEDGASVKLQALLNLTASRLLNAITLDLDTAID